MTGTIPRGTGATPPAASLDDRADPAAARRSLRYTVARLRATPAPLAFDRMDPIELPDRDWDGTSRSRPRDRPT